SLANFVKVQAEKGNPWYAPLQSLGMLSASQAPNAPFATPFWALQAYRGPVQGHLWAMGFTLKVKDMVLPEQEGQLTQFVQINSTRKAEWRSPSLGTRSLAFDGRGFTGTQLLDWKFDDTTLDGKPLRRVTLKVGR